MNRIECITQSDCMELSLYRVKTFLADLKKEYPMHDVWYQGVMEEIKKNSSREILILRAEQELAGIAILKSTEKERKICTLRVHKDFQNQGVGRALIKKSMEFLETDKPHITISQNKQDEFKKILLYFGFNLDEIYRDKYKEGVCEYSYNGILLPESILRNEKIKMNFKQKSGDIKSA